MDEHRIEAIGVLAFAGDLSMGQPVDHSPRTALMAQQLALSAGAAPIEADQALLVALLRWAGCTANAREFSALFGDDIKGRANLLAGRNPFVGKPLPATPIDHLIAPMAAAHCEAGVEIARQLELDANIAPALADVFEHWDGSGYPSHKHGESIHPVAQVVQLAGDVDVLVRSFGAAKGLSLVESRGGIRYDPALVRLVLRDATQMLQRVEDGQAWIAARTLLERGGDASAPLSLDSLAFTLADFADLKMPEAVTGARQIAALVSAAGRALKLPADDVGAATRAGLLCGLGRVTVSNTTLERKGPLGEADWEALRLVPHWTDRILRRAPGLAASAAIAAQAFERLDGRGYHRGLTAPQIERPARLVQCAVAAVALLSPRPWRAALAPGQVVATLDACVAANELDAACVNAIAGAIDARPGSTRNALAAGAPELTPREREVLLLLAVGESNKSIARALLISPRTAGTHVEALYRKLGVSTRAAAALRAVRAGLI